MSILRYLQPKDNLPDPKGPLSRSLPSSAIVAANEEVLKVTDAVKTKCTPYKKYTPEERFEIGRYACAHGITTAARHFSKTFQRSVS